MILELANSEIPCGQTTSFANMLILTFANFLICARKITYFLTFGQAFSLFSRACVHFYIKKAEPHDAKELLCRRFGKEK